MIGFLGFVVIVYIIAMFALIPWQRKMKRNSLESEFPSYHNGAFMQYLTRDYHPFATENDPLYARRFELEGEFVQYKATRSYSFGGAQHVCWPRWDNQTGDFIVNFDHPPIRQINKTLLREYKQRHPQQ